MKICVLQPDYSTTSVDYQYYDPPRSLSHLLPEAQVDHVFLNKLTTYKQLKELSTQGYDCFVNLCEGYLQWEVPSIDVVYFLQMLNLPFTGPTDTLYNPAKEMMKYVAYTEGVQSPAYAVLCKGGEILPACAHLRYPLFVKPAHEGDSLGIDKDSLVQNKEALATKLESLWNDYNEVMVEEYIGGREFTVLVAANADRKTCTAFAPLEYVFSGDPTFKTYELKTSSLHPECNVMVTDSVLAEELKEISRRIFTSFGGVGYARLDFRMNGSAEIYFLEINFTCSVFYADGYEGSADYILQNDGIGQQGFLRHIIAEGMARHRRNKKKYTMRGNAISGFGIYAVADLAKGETIFCGEESEHRLVTRRHVQQHWTDEEQKTFRHYAVPLSDEVYAIWDKEPEHWAPQNHSCNPNTGYDGLNVVALKGIRKGEELTLDYTTFLNEASASFECHCGAGNCRKIISGTKGTSVTEREAKRNNLVELANCLQKP
jgi:D-alanine-D-alanine ligase-like ATP-grasp enzyme